MTEENLRRFQAELCLCGACAEVVASSSVAKYWPSPIQGHLKRVGDIGFEQLAKSPGFKQVCEKALRQALCEMHEEEEAER